MRRHRPPVTYFAATVVQPNDTLILCPDNEATIQINATSPSDRDGKPIHASKFKITRGATGTTTGTQKCTTYRIGQSPPEKTCEDFLVAGLESGLGLYQFVSERTNRDLQSRSNTAVIQLLEKMKEKDASQPLMLGGKRFTVNSFTPEQQGPANDGCLRYHLSVTDNSGKQINVPITQAGLPFHKAVLTAESIARASKMMDEHLAFLTGRSDGQENEPLILSLAGYGRNATLMTYRDLCLRIKEGSVTTNEQIELQLRKFIEEQREIRPGFVHSLEQVEQLVIALDDQLRNHQVQSSQLDAPPKIHHARSTSPVGAARHLSVVRPSAAPTTRIGTSLDKNLESMQVDGIAVSSDTKFTNQKFETALGVACERFKFGRNAEFERIATQSLHLLSMSRRSSAPTPQHVLVTGLPPKGPRDRHPYLPYQVMKFIDQTLTAAAKSGLKSVGFAASLLEPTTPKPRRLGIPLEQMAALAVAAVDRHAAKSRKQISVTFQCADEAQQAIVDDVIANRDEFTKHQNLQALLRLPNNMPTDIPATACADFGDPEKRASFAPVKFVRSPHNKRMFHPATPLPTVVNESKVPLAPWPEIEVPTTQAKWEKGDVKFENEPSSDGVQAAGVVIEEDDGRVWVVAPTGGFAGMINTFPKGQMRDDDDDLVMWSPQATARKEAYEESGLQVVLTGFLCDYKGSRQNTRYYRAKRIGGTPADVGWESQAVHLVPKDQLRGMMTSKGNRRENFVLDAFDGPRESEAAFAKLDAMLSRDDCKLDGKEFDSVARGVALSMQFIGSQRPQTDLVPVDQVLSRDDSRQPQKSTVLRILGATGNAPGYLHANRIELGVSRNYIAAQYPFNSKLPGPKSKDNRDDFWRAAVDSEVSLIVDLTQTDEKENDDSYAPVGKGPLELPTYELRSSSVTPRHGDNPHISKSVIKIKPNQSGPPKEVRRMHFTQWKDKTAIDVDALIDLANQIILNSKDNETVLIHCSHGVGRTGTLISFLAASEKITTAIGPGNQLSVADFLGIVREVLIKGRQARGEQYVATVQFPLLVKALLKKHFDDTIANGMLIPKTPPANIT